MAETVAAGRVVAHGRYVIPIPGTKTPKYLLENAGAADVQLSPDNLAELNDLACT
jgi:aryl-alcohol dehydrogenase-like predicted oxidoreductase